MTTWFYVQSSDEGGSYAQVRGDSSTERFRDVYRRCIAVFFRSARKANPEARLVLYLNKPWDSSASRVAGEVSAILAGLNVEIRVVEYDHRPPATFSKSWRNQFFVLDVLNDLSACVGPEDNWLVLDSDIVWSGQSTKQLWGTLGAEGLSTYRVGYDRNKSVNGLSLDALADLGHRHGIPQDEKLAYSGGEFVGGRGNKLRALSEESHRIWEALMASHDRDPSLQFEEAHLLSLSYSALAVAPGGMNPFIRRLWTQPFKDQNVSAFDGSLALWHVPAEKKYGIRRIYRKLNSSRSPMYLSMPTGAWVTFCTRELGIPKNSLVKVVRDVATALRARVAASR